MFSASAWAMYSSEPALPQCRPRRCWRGTPPAPRRRQRRRRNCSWRRRCSGHQAKGQGQCQGGEQGRLFHGDLPFFWMRRAGRRRGAALRPFCAAVLFVVTVLYPVKIKAATRDLEKIFYFLWGGESGRKKAACKPPQTAEKVKIRRRFAAQPACGRSVLTLPAPCWERLRYRASTSSSIKGEKGDGVVQQMLAGGVADAGQDEHVVGPGGPGRTGASWSPERPARRCAG